MIFIWSYLLIGAVYSFVKRSEITLRNKFLWIVAFLIDCLVWGFKVLAKMVRDIFILFGSFSFLLLFSKVGTDLMINTLKIVNVENDEEKQNIQSIRLGLLEDAVDKSGKSFTSFVVFIYTSFLIVGGLLSFVVVFPAFIGAVPRIFERR